ncbi:aspartate-semialdehyde dehydrogenase [Nitrincola tapanii]|uniref:Semialdehyde dehydrogenase NAD-binding domain-containing protein n=1 Tax=Nitrincola tapanii TaxID=1708751 RepID=A0A5A9W5N3_9GAMM|nr:Asd/ArgC dimerization domain-containing protein [Nitrincola tapanii]KAA0875853.1 hypothetical protein E1H14_03985 [Nitrincola tapanii]
MSMCVALLGASSLIGEHLLEQLELRDFPVTELRLADHDTDTERGVMFKGHATRVKPLAAMQWQGVDLVFNCTGSALSAELKELLQAQGSWLIEVAASVAGALPLVPEVNSQALSAAQRHLQVPPAAAILVAMALKPLHQRYTLLRLNLTSLASVAEVGRQGIEALAGETARLLNGRDAEAEFFQHQMAFNLLPVTSALDAQGQSQDEKEIATSVQTLLEDEQLEVVVSALRVPLFYGQTVVIHAECQQPMDLVEAQALLKNVPGVSLRQDELVSPVGSCAGEDQVLMTRLRLEPENPSGFALVVMADNLRKGSALNAVQLAELILASA